MFFPFLTKLLFFALVFVIVANPVGGILDNSGPVVFLPERLDNLVKNPEESNAPIKVDGKDLEVETTAQSVVVIDNQSGEIIYAKNPYQKAPIASLTKLMTAYIFLQMNPDGRRTITISKEDDAPPAKIQVKEGDTITAKDLFFSGLVASANNAVKAFARLTGLSTPEYAEKMNETAKEWGLENTKFVEPTGLDPLNQSTAYEVAIMARRVFQEPAIRKATLTDKYLFQPVNAENTYLAATTDKLLNEVNDFQITGGKTGYLEEAGYCLVVQAKNNQGNEIIAVILGSESDEARFSEMKELINKVFEIYKWPAD